MFFTCFSQDIIAGRNGTICVKENARAVSERDDRLLAERMEKLSSQQTGDTESDDETMGNAEVE